MVGPDGGGPVNTGPTDGDIDLSDVDLGQLDFWSRPLEERAAAFAALRRLDRPVLFPEPEMPGMEALGFRRGDGHYALVRHADVVEASRRPEVFCSSRGTIAGTLDPPPEFMEYFGSMITMDDPRHARLRRIVSRAFTDRVIARVSDAIDAAAVRIIEDFRPKGGGDFVTEVAGRLPLKIICDFMGVPEDRHERVFELSNLIIGSFDPEYVPDLAELGPSVLAAGEELRRMVHELAAERAEHPRDDLTSVLVRASVDGESLTDAELGSFFILLIVAGNETTRNAIAHGLHLLTRHPDQRGLWTSDFERHAPTAVEEIVRYASPVSFMRRTVTRDYELGGHVFHDGDKVLMYYCSANRDESVFDDPDAFDITRTPNPHLGFGAPGPHFCLGAHLARQEITVMFRELFRRLPDIHATAPPERLTSNFVNGIKHLECAF
ncbi:cytochrome P450 [Actinomadura logoneensis]|uniref:Cytochrome P450 n=1 Tax=Actinomadura logoneensis TaxID=2293572 RepID=A0A372JIG7_9ACTN|nr:cytochrome P450 [Actinomadura logoneensis]RFU39709.1 cytochrome P450 [Actinomadura logoneensis]